MKRFAAFAVLALFAGLNGSATPPIREGALGEYWDEWNVDMFQFHPEGLANWINAVKGTNVPGKWVCPTDTTLNFVPEDEKVPGGSWTCRSEDGFLFLTDKAGVEKKYRCETRNQRYARAAGIFIEMANLAKARLAALDDKTLGLVRKKEAELQAQLDGLIASFGGPPNLEKDEIVRVAKMRQPDILDDIALTAKNGKQAVLRVDCLDNLRKVSVFLRDYVAKYKKYPEKLIHLQKPDLARDVKIFNCPATGKEDAFQYVYPAKGDLTPSDAVLAYDREPHADGSRTVMIYSGAVVQLDKDKFAVALEKGLNAVK